jgi:hypothetical protein
MRIFAVHDVEGNIHQIVVSPPDAPVATITTELGLMITEIEVPDGVDLVDPERSGQQLSEVLQHFQVEVGAKAKLIRKKTRHDNKDAGSGRPLNAPAAFIHPCQPIVAKQPPPCCLRQLLSSGTTIHGLPLPTLFVAWHSESGPGALRPFYQHRY